MAEQSFNNIKTEPKDLNYTKGKYLGQGADGKVYLVVRKSDGLEFAQKQIDLRNKSNDVINEIINSAISHS